MHVGEPIVLIVAEQQCSCARCGRAGRDRLCDRCRTSRRSPKRLRPARRSSGRRLPGNVAIDWSMPTVGAGGDGLDAIFKTAAHVARVDCGQPAHRGVVDGAARRDRSYDAKAGSLLAALVLARARPRLREQLVAVLGVTASRSRLRFRRRRRRVRHEDVGLSGIHRAADRRAPDRTAGPLDVGSHGSVPHRQPGARHGHRRRARARCEGQVSRTARASIWPAWAPILRPPAPTSRR